MHKYLLSFLILLFPLTTSAYSLINKTVDGHVVKIFHIPHSDDFHVEAVASNTGTTLKELVNQVR